MHRREQLIRKDGKFLSVDDLDSPDSIREHVLETKRKGISDEFFMVAGTQEGYHRNFCWPVGVRTELTEVLTKRAALKKAYDDGMSLIYQLSNKIARGEL